MMRSRDLVDQSELVRASPDARTWSRCASVLNNAQRTSAEIVMKSKEQKRRSFLFGLAVLGVERT
jgi:hypothetical protein